MSDKQNKKTEVKKIAASVLASDKRGRVRDVWRVQSGGVHTTLATSASSTTVIDGAVKRYSNALKRLAKR
jgi:hypothetical protein